MDFLKFFFNLHQIMYSFGQQREKVWGEGHFKVFPCEPRFKEWTMSSVLLQDDALRLKSLTLPSCSPGVHPELCIVVHSTTFLMLKSHFFGTDQFAISLNLTGDD